jgi:two-component system sensor histidine kinase RegB
VTIEASWDEEMVSVTIADDGPGFAASVMERLGEPYLTSRPAKGAEGKPEDEQFGLGLGFFIAKTLLERSGARIEYANREAPRTGAIVKIEWPRDAIRTASV